MKIYIKTQENRNLKAQTTNEKEDEKLGAQRRIIKSLNKKLATKNIA